MINDEKIYLCDLSSLDLKLNLKCNQNRPNHLLIKTLLVF